MFDVLQLRLLKILQKVRSNDQQVTKAHDMKVHPNTSA